MLVTCAVGRENAARGREGSMERLGRLAASRPLGFSLSSVAVVLATMGAAAAAASALSGRGLADAEMQIAGQVAGIVLLLLALWRLGWLDSAGVTRLGDRRSWIVTSIILLYTGLCALWSFLGTLTVDLSVDGAAAPVLLHTTLAGVVEELLFRGLVLCVLIAGWGRTRPGVVAAVLVSAVLFGASHLVNLASSSVDVTLLQVTEASLSAIVYGALVVAGGSLWPAVALHSFVNLVVNAAAENIPGFAAGVGELLMFTVLELPVVLYAAYLLSTQGRPSDQEQTVEAVAG
jgi:membrane protease YdiL (CAAX protease family)